MANLTDVLSELPGPRTSPEKQIGDDILPLGDLLKPVITDPKATPSPNIVREIVCPRVTRFSISFGEWCLHGSFEPNRYDTDTVLAEIGVDVRNPASPIYDQLAFCSASGCPEELPSELAKLSDFDRAVLEAALETATQHI